MKFDLDYISKNEIWVPVVGFEGLYEVSSFGRVRSLGNGSSNNSKKRIMKISMNKEGYFQITLSKNNKIKSHRIHRLVATAFLENPNNFPQVNHKDENISNNNVNNLEWCDRKYNINYGTRNKRVSEKMKNGKLSKVILQYDLEGNFIAEFPSIMEVQRQFGFNNSLICCVLKCKKKSAYGYIWKYK